MGMGASVEHIHYLNDLDNIENDIRNSWFFTEQQINHIEKCREVRRVIDSQFDEYHWYVITLVRDSVSRAISSYFFNTHKIESEGRVDKNINVSSCDRLINLDEHNIEIEDHSSWFDDHIKDVFGVDVYDIDGANDAPFFTYRKENVSIILLKMERLTECSGEAFREFLGLEKF
jgi:hypothetical protein